MCASGTKPVEKNHKIALSMLFIWIFYNDLWKELESNYNIVVLKYIAIKC